MSDGKVCLAQKEQRKGHVDDSSNLSLAPVQRGTEPALTWLQSKAFLSTVPLRTRILGVDERGKGVGFSNFWKEKDIAHLNEVDLLANYF